MFVEKLLREEEALVTKQEGTACVSSPFVQLG
jgi:hypothetical protein